MSGQLPPGWCVVRVGDLARADEQPVLTGPFGTNIGREDFVSEGCPVLTIGCLTDAGIKLDRAMFVRHQKAEELERYRLRAGDLLFSRMASVGRAGMVPEALDGALFNYHIMRLRLADEKMLPELFLAYVRGAPAVRKYLEDVNHGATRDGINTAQLVEMPVALPPLNEQRRIVAKLEALQARSRRARQALDAVPPLLEKLRQSILAAAFRGDLTKDWRAKNKDIEPASKLLERIRAERRKKWEEAELAKMTAKGKAPTDDKWKAKYKEPELVDTTGLPRLPDGWCWATLDELLAEGLANGRSVPTDDKGFPVLRLTALRHGTIDLRERKGGAWSAAEAAPFLVSKGDFLVSRGNGSIGLVGRGGLVTDEPDGVAYPDTLIRVRAHDLIDQGYLARVWSSQLVRRQIERAAKTTAGIFKVSQGDLQAIAIPVPDVREQRCIALQADAMLERVRSLEVLVEGEQTRAITLERAVLAKAFRGELVPQDPDDEAAGAIRDRAGKAGTITATIGTQSEGRRRRRPAQTEVSDEP